VRNLSFKRVWVIAGVVALIALAVAGIALAAGGLSKGKGQKAGATAWRDCMAAHGVELTGERPSYDTVRSALQACGLPGSKKLKAFASCLQERGIELPPAGQLPSFSFGDLRSAARECGLDAAKIRSALEQKRNELRASVDDFASCMRDRGVTLPTEASSLRGALGSLLLLDRDTLKQAFESCRGELRIPGLGILGG
jgi:hypothetical protein